MISESPAALKFTRPALFTVATFGLDDAHCAWLVTLCAVEFDSCAVAVSCSVAPTVPVQTAAAHPGPFTMTLVTVGEGVGAGVGAVGVERPPPPPHASVSIRNAVTPPSVSLDRLQRSSSVLFVLPTDRGTAPRTRRGVMGRITPLETDADRRIPSLAAACSSLIFADELCIRVVHTYRE